MLYKQPATSRIYRMGPFIIRRNLPGAALPDYHDHGYGPLALFDDAILEPGTLIPMHEHRNDEIISYVPQGVMRHNDSTETKLEIDRSQLMVMNAGDSFWHEERTLENDEAVRMLQIFVRPHTLDLEPRLQHQKLEEPVPNTWRYLVGPEGTDAPLTVRNEVRLFDTHLDSGAVLELPTYGDWDIYFYVFQGGVSVQDETFAEGEQGLLVDTQKAVVRALQETLLVVFLVDRTAQVTRVGTIGR